MSKQPAENTTRMVAAGVLTWLLPGAGHFYLGQKRLAAIFFCAISLPYLTGVAVGGVKTTVNPHLNRWLFLAEMGVGGLTTTFYLVGNSVGGFDAQATARVIRKTGPFRRLSLGEQERQQRALSRYVVYYPASDIAQIYLAVAGLLNLLAILDAMTRAQTGGLPVYHHELRPVEEGAPQ